MPNILKTIGKQVEQAQLILANTQDQEVKNKMALYNVGPEKLAEGQKLLDTVTTIINQTNDVHMERKNAVKCFEKAALETKRYFWNHAVIAKYVMDPVMLADLNLKGRLKVSFIGWFEEDTNFYKAAVEKILDREHAAFTYLWDNLTLKQKRLLLALALKKPGDKLFSAGFLEKHQLGSSGTVQRGLKSLNSKSIIDKEGDSIEVNDIFFKAWLIKRIARLPAE